MAEQNGTDGLGVGSRFVLLRRGCVFAVSIAAGVMALTARSNWRWSGLFLLALAASVALDSAMVGAVALLAFAVVLWKDLFGQAPT